MSEYKLDPSPIIGAPGWVEDALAQAQVSAKRIREGNVIQFPSKKISNQTKGPDAA